jgi:hypothetical protein
MLRDPRFRGFILLLAFALATGFPTAAQVSGGTVHNANPNYAAIREYGRIERHGINATLIAGGSRPLDMAAYTLSTCLGLSVSSEDPRYEFRGDLLDVTAPQWSALHPNDHVYAGRPGRVEVQFAFNEQGAPEDMAKLLNDAVEQANAQLPWSYKVTTRTIANHSFYSFVPTRYHNAAGELNDEPAYLDTRVSIPPKTARISEFANAIAVQMTAALGQHFFCCTALIYGRGWGSAVIHYEATGIPARIVLEDLLAGNGGDSYNLRCEPLGKQGCFINAHATAERLAAPNGVCVALGYDER